MASVQDSTFLARSPNVNYVKLFAVVVGFVAGVFCEWKYGSPPKFYKPDFFGFKLFQTIVTAVLLISLFLLDQLCGQFTAPQLFVKSTATAEHCNDFTIFGLNTTSELDVMSDLEKWFKLNNSDQPIFIDDFMDEMASKFPTRRQCYRVSEVSAFKNAFNGVTTEPFEMVADMQALLFYLGFVVFIVNFFHAWRQGGQNSSKYHLFDYLCVGFGVIIWCYSIWISAFLLHNWTMHWECTNFRPDNLWVLLIILVLSSALVCTSLFEIFFNRLLLQNTVPSIHSKNAAIKGTGEAKKNAVVAKAKKKNEEELFIVRVAH
uniref:Uncharacterized protein n=1 Tax=Globodera rostochiensis TaxID=31243 RepID=A0A914H0N3_GLORO